MSLSADHEADRERQLDTTEIRSILEDSLAMENNLMRTYLITADRIHDSEDLKVRLQNFAEGNAKRSLQLQDELERLP